MADWLIKGRYFEACNCAYGCPCNFNGFPTHGFCDGLVSFAVDEGHRDGVDLSGVKVVAAVQWPGAIHEGNGKLAAFVDAESDEQREAIGKILMGEDGGMPWEILGPTFQVAGLVKAKITIEGSGRKSTFRIEGVGEGRGDALKNPVTGEDHIVNVDLPTGFIWKKGEAGQGSFRAAAGGLSVAFDKTNWILYEFDWTNRRPSLAAA